MRPSPLPVAVLVALACTGEVTPPSPGPPTDAGAAGSAAVETPATAPQADGGSPAAIPIASARALHGGVESPLSTSEVTEVDPASHFRVEAQSRIEDARLALLDERDALVPVQGTVEIGETSRYTLVPDGALRPGTIYSLRLEGTKGRMVHDSGGRALLPVTFRLRAAGDRHTVPKRKRGRRRRLDSQQP